MKLGTTASLRRYDFSLYCTPQSAHVRLVRRRRYDLCGIAVESAINDRSIGFRQICRQQPFSATIEQPQAYR
jgi:hypothetical protein